MTEDLEGRSAPDAYGVGGGELRWHYGPTADDHDPGKMWCYGCSAEVWVFDGVYSCTGCDKESDS